MAPRHPPAMVPSTEEEARTDTAKLLIADSKFRSMMRLELEAPLDITWLKFKAAYCSQFRDMTVHSWCWRESRD
jgi:hypothetical protein